MGLLKTRPPPCRESGGKRGNVEAGARSPRPILCAKLRRFATAPGKTLRSFRICVFWQWSCDNWF